jgi:predicted DNA binding CopG/RHH family protein
LSKDKTLKDLPPLLSDEEAEQFTSEADLSEYDLSGFKPVQFEFLKKSARMELRLPQDQLDALKQAARQKGIPYTRLVRQFIDEGMRSLSQHPNR